MALPTELGLWFQTEHRKMLPLGAKRWLVFGQHFRQIENADSMSLSDSGAVLSGTRSARSSVPASVRRTTPLGVWLQPFFFITGLLFAFQIANFGLSSRTPRNALLLSFCFSG